MIEENRMKYMEFVWRKLERKYIKNVDKHALFYPLVRPIKFKGCVGQMQTQIANTIFIGEEELNMQKTQKQVRLYAKAKIRNFIDGYISYLEDTIEDLKNFNN